MKDQSRSRTLDQQQRKTSNEDRIYNSFGHIRLFFKYFWQILALQNPLVLILLNRAEAPIFGWNKA